MNTYTSPIQDSIKRQPLGLNRINNPYNPQLLANQNMQRNQALFDTNLQATKDRYAYNNKGGGASAGDIANAANGALSWGAGVVGDLTGDAQLSQASDMRVGRHNLLNANKIAVMNKSNVGTSALSGAATGASIGTSIMPGWGTAIGAVVGGLGSMFGSMFGNKRKKRRAERQRERVAIANQNRLDDALAQDIYNSQFAMGGLLNNMSNYYADGGGIYINPSKRGTFTAAATKHGMGVQAFASRVLANKDNYSPAMVKKANFARNASKWHAFGGDLNGLTEFNGGGSHEENPNGGIQQGNGNMVEEGETRFEDYIFSDRLNITDEVISLFNLPKKLKNKTFAEASKNLNEEAKDRPLDPISNLGQDEMMERLMAANDYIRENNNIRTFAEGGQLHEEIVPEEVEKGLGEQMVDPNAKAPKIQKLTKQNLRGGEADTKFLKNSETDVDPIELQAGIIVEREHTTSDKVAQEIALDHLAENPNYYTLLYGAGIADEKLPPEIMEGLMAKMEQLQAETEQAESPEDAMMEDEMMQQAMMQDQMQQGYGMENPEMMGTEEDLMMQNQIDPAMMQNMGMMALGGLLYDKRPNRIKVLADGGRIERSTENGIYRIGDKRYVLGKKPVSDGSFGIGTSKSQDWLLDAETGKPVNDKLMNQFYSEIAGFRNREALKLKDLQNSRINISPAQVTGITGVDALNKHRKALLNKHVASGRQAASSDPKKKDLSTSAKIASVARFAPAASGFLGALLAAREKPESIGFSPIRHISDYMTERPVDRNFIMNNLGRQAASNRYAIQQMGNSNVGNIMANLQALNYGTQGAMANAGQAIDKENYQRYADRVRHNTGVNQFNRNIDMNNSQMAFNVENLNAQHRAAKRNAIRKYLMSGVESLGNIGREQTSVNSIDNMFGYRPSIFGGAGYNK